MYLQSRIPGSITRQSPTCAQPTGGKERGTTRVSVHGLLCGTDRWCLLIDKNGTICPLSSYNASTMAALVYECGGNAYVSAGMARDSDGRLVLDITNGGQPMMRHKRSPVDWPVSEFIKELSRFGRRSCDASIRFKRETFLAYDTVSVPTMYARGVWAYIEIVAYSKTKFSVEGWEFPIAAGKARSFLAYYGPASECTPPTITPGDAGCLVTYGAAATDRDQDLGAI